MLAFLQFDSAAQPVVERMLADGRLPVLADLRRRGEWRQIDAAATVLQSATYPTLCSGMDVRDHGIYSALLWSAAEQRSRFAHTFATPPAIWDRLSVGGRRALVIDPYLAWPPSRMNGVFLSGWQFRDRMVQPGRALPRPVGRRLTHRHGRSPALHDVYGRHDGATLLALSEALAAAPARAARGAIDVLRLAPFDLVWLNFSAAHKAGHHLWDPRAILTERDRDAAKRLDGALERVYEAVDQALGMVLAALPPRADVIVFSPTGMGDNTSRADMLPGMLDAVLGGRAAGAPTVVERRDASVWSIRAAIPVAWRAHLASLLPDRFVADVTTRLYSQASRRGAPALVVPGEHKGYIRLNLAGRERDGMVAPGDAGSLMERIAEGLMTFRDPDGSPAVRAVERMTTIAGTRPSVSSLPDLVVSWGDRQAAAVTSAVSPRFGTVPRLGVGSGRTGNHTDDAWMILVPGASRVRILPRAARIVDLGATACALLGADMNGLAGTPLLE